MDVDPELSNEHEWQIHFDAGNAAVKSGDFVAAVTSFAIAREIATRLELIDESFKSLVALGRAQMRSGQLQLAEETAMRSIGLASKNYREKPLPNAFAKSLLGELFLEEGRVAEAEPILSLAVAEFKQPGVRSSPEFVPVVLSLAACYLHLENFELADKWSRYAFALCKRFAAPTDAATLMATEFCAIAAEGVGQGLRAAILRSRINTPMYRGGKIGTSNELNANVSLMKIVVPEPEWQIVVEVRDDGARLNAVREALNLLGSEDQLYESEGSADGVIPIQNPLSDVLSVDSERLRFARKKLSEAMRTTGVKRAKLAREALAISEDCADAYIVLAETHKEPGERTKLYRDAVAAGERLLGARWRDRYQTNGWAMIETRPMMRAMASLANHLQREGNLEEALGLYRELIKLNSSDDQGIRYRLIGCLYVAGYDEELEKIFESYASDPTANFAYTKALYLFRKQGASDFANTALMKAFEVNKHVPFLLSGIAEMPEAPPDRVGFGDEAEAIAYLFDNGNDWSGTAGATEWMGTILSQATRRMYADKAMAEEAIRALKAPRDK